MKPSIPWFVLWLMSGHIATGLISSALQAEAGNRAALCAAMPIGGEGVPDWLHLLPGALQTYVFAFFAFVENHSIEMRVLLNIPAGSPDALEASRLVQKAAAEGISRLLAQLTVAGQISDLDAAAEYIKAGLHALARQLMQTRARPQELAELAAQLVWSGLRGRG